MPHRVTPRTEQSLELKAGVWQQCRGQFSPWAARNHEMIMKSHTRAVQLASPSLDQLQLSFLETAPGCCRDVFSSLHPSDSLLSKHFLQSPGLGSKSPPCVTLGLGRESPGSWFYTGLFQIRQQNDHIGKCLRKKKKITAKSKRSLTGIYCLPEAREAQHPS